MLVDVSLYVLGRPEFGAAAGVQPQIPIHRRWRWTKFCKGA